MAYYECGGCGALQTEQPYWLEEAYQVKGLNLDVGACQRCLNLSLELAACLTVLGVGHQPCLDFGSGLGLFARQMRDRGFDFRAYDKFIRPFFMDQFPGTLTSEKWSALTAFEVFEHMVSPATECGEIFAVRPDFLFFTTQVWQGQGLDWWYISPEGGQHVFFHSRKSLQLLGAQHGYAHIDLKSVQLFLPDALAKETRAFSGAEKMKYRWNRSARRKGRNLPADTRTRLHLLRDAKTMRELSRYLFLQHQNEALRWVERDYKILRLASTPDDLEKAALR